MKVSQVTLATSTKPWFRPLSRRIMLSLLVLILLAGIAVLGFSRQILTIDSGDVEADAIVVLGGGEGQHRPERAAELVAKGRAPLVLVSGAGDFDLNVNRLEKAGLSASAIMVENRSRSTLQNAQFSIPLLRKMGAHRVIIVTSWYHSRRALKCFQQLAPDIQFASCPSYWGNPYEEWYGRDIGGYLVVEYAKLLGYWVCYGVSPF